MTPRVLSVISRSPEVVNEAAERLPEGSPVMLPVAREKEPSPFKVVASPPMDRRLKLPPASIENGVPRMPNVHEPSRPMWTLGLSRAEAERLLDKVRVIAPEFVDRILVREPAT